MKQLLPLFFLFISFNLLAQQTTQKITIRGAVVDSLSKEPLSFVTLILYNSANAQPIKSALTQDNGAFEFIVPVNKYDLALAYVGYLPKTIKVTAAGENSVVDLGTITMSASQGQLKEVSITAAKPLLIKEIDRISFDVQADPESKSNDALEMLRKVPMVTVDGNDVIQLKGSSSYRIFINGKPSALMANNPSEVLKAMPAATIKKIEVITIPPSKYDGEGLAGIINIITLQKTDEGINGSVFARYNNIFGERGSISLSAKKDKFGINAFFGLGRQPLKALESGSQLTTFSPATILSQQGQNVNGGNFNNGQATLSYEADSLDLLTVSMDFVNRKFTQNSSRYSQFFILPDSLTQSYHLNNIGENSIGALDLGVNYQLGFKRDKNELLTLSYLYASTNNDQTNNVTATDRFNYGASDYDQQNGTGSGEHTFQLDFIKPVKKLIIEAGAKAILRNNHSNFADENFSQAIGQYLPDTALSNKFNYHQNVYSIYNTYQLKIAEWIFKAGLRVENTAISGDYTSENNFADQHYINFIPALSIQRSSQKTGTFSIGFTERIERPGIRQLNPFVDRSNPEFIVTGNPELRPVLNHIFELSYSKFAKVSVNASVSYEYATNTIQSVTSLISDTVSETTYLNVGKNQSAGLNLSANYPVTDRLNFNINAQLAHLWITGTYNSQFYKNDGNQGNLDTYARYKFDHDYNVGIGMDYFSGNIYLQGKSSDFIFTSVVIIKDFFKKRFTVSLTVSNPFEQFNNSSSYTKTPDFQQSSYGQNYYRNFRLAFNYKFGKLKSSIETNKRGIKNDDVKGNGNGSEN